MKDRRVYFTAGGKRVFAHYHDPVTGDHIRTARLFEEPEEIEHVIIKVGVLSTALGFIAGIMTAFSIWTIAT